MFSDSDKESSSSGFQISIFTQNFVFRGGNLTGSGRPILVKPRFNAEDTIRLVGLQSVSPEPGSSLFLICSVALEIFLTNFFSDHFFMFP